MKIILFNYFENYLVNFFIYKYEYTFNVYNIENEANLKMLIRLYLYLF